MFNILEIRVGPYPRGWDDQVAVLRKEEKEKCKWDLITIRSHCIYIDEVTYEAGAEEGYIERGPSFRVPLQVDAAHAHAAEGIKRQKKDR